MVAMTFGEGTLWADAYRGGQQLLGGHGMPLSHGAFHTTFPSLSKRVSDDGGKVSVRVGEGRLSSI